MLPPDIPHNEAILIPNHYKMRATTSAEYIPDGDGKRVSGIEENSVGTRMKYIPPFPNHLHPGNPKHFQQDSLISKPSAALDMYEVKPSACKKIDPDRESQIAWSDEDSVHTEWSESNVWSDEEDFAFDRGQPFVT